MENNQNNNQTDKKSVSTRGNKYYNTTCGVPSALEVIYYDNAARIVFTPELPESQRTERRVFDYDHQVLTSLSRAKANELYNAYEEKIIPAIKEGRDEQVSVPLANVNQLMITTDPDANGVPRPKIKLIKNINPETLIANDSDVIYYEFNVSEYILGYNEKTGSFKERVTTYNELELFMKDLQSMVEATSNAYCHTDRVVNKFWKDTLDEKLVKIGATQGLDLAFKSNRGSYGNATQGSIFDNRPSANNNEPSTTITSIDQLDNELPFN